MASLDWQGATGVLIARGAWDAHGAGPLARQLATALPEARPWRLDTEGITRMDTAGALLLLHVIEWLEG
ncbi:MAG: STAS domain-containing protein, partial [Halothiobacillaceae bacterium]